jgi:hypothetical protein
MELKYVTLASSMLLPDVIEILDVLEDPAQLVYLGEGPLVEWRSVLVHLGGHVNLDWEYAGRVGEQFVFLDKIGGL